MTLEKACKTLLIKSPFLGLFLMSLNKYFSDDVETAGVRLNGINTELAINEDFWNSLDDDKKIGLLTHELYHIAFKHMTLSSEFDNHKLFNISADLEINSYIGKENLPEGGMFVEDFGLEPYLGTKAYYSKLEAEENSNSGSKLQKMLSGENGDDEGSSNGSGTPNEDGETIDDHGFWKDFSELSEAEKELVSNQIDSVVKNVTEQTQKLQGSIPAGLKSYIDSLFKVKPAVFNWKQYFRRLLGTAIDIYQKKTRKKESIRFPGASGLKHKRKSNIFVIMDTSGSVSNEDIKDFFSEIYHVWKTGSIVTICECDAAIQRIYEYNGKWDGSCSGRGGTVLDDAINYYDAHRRDYQSLIILTDGYLYIPNNYCLNHAIWIITRNGNNDQKYPGKSIFIPNNN